MKNFAIGFAVGVVAFALTNVGRAITAGVGIAIADAKAEHEAHRKLLGS